MTESVKRLREQLIPAFERHRVIRAGLFGSVARGEARPESDLDVVVVDLELAWSMVKNHLPTLARPIGEIVTELKRD